MKKQIFIVISIWLTGCTSADQCERKIRQESTDETFSGIISKSYFKIGEHGTPTVELADGKVIYLSTRSIICYTQPGDSIFKEKGSLKYLVKRRDSITIFYPECGQTLIMDSNKTLVNPDYMRQISCDKYQ